jgi:hypothetical protein
MSDGLSVKLGARDYTIVAQPIGRIRRKLGKLIALNEGAAALDGELDGEAYSALKTFIPDLAPVWELLGYETEDAYKSGAEPSEDAEAADRSPTLPQIIEAFEAVYRVNGADRLVRLGKSLVKEDVLKAIISKELISWSSARSSSSPSPNGESDLTSSTTTPPAPDENEDSPSLASSIS